MSWGRSRFGICDIGVKVDLGVGAVGMGLRRENGRVQGHRKRGKMKHLIGARPGWAKRKGIWIWPQRGAVFGVVLVASGNRGNKC
jgi:hypothetical protein